MLIGISFSLDLSENSKKNINTMSLVDYDYWGKRGEKINYNDIILLKFMFFYHLKMGDYFH